MRLESLLSLIDAKLCSQPTIQSFNEIHINPKKVSRGDLYIALNPAQDDIDCAITNGAYGIIYDLPLIITDQETAWIKVENVKVAERKLLRFQLTAKQLKVYSAHAATVSYIKMLKSSSELFIIEASLDDISSKLWNIKQNQTLVIREQENLKTLFPTAQSITNVASFINIYPVTPFESDITLHSNHYKRQKLPLALSLYFSQAVSFLEEQTFTFSLSNLNYPSYCDIVSCDKYLNIKDFGQGFKTLIFLNSSHFLEDFAKSIEDLAPWINYTLFLSENENILRYNDTIRYSNTDDCVALLQKNTFDYALIIGQNRTLLDHVPKPFQQSLF